MKSCWGSPHLPALRLKGSLLQLEQGPGMIISNLDIISAFQSWPALSMVSFSRHDDVDRQRRPLPSHQPEVGEVTPAFASHCEWALGREKML